MHLKNKYEAIVSNEILNNSSVNLPLKIAGTMAWYCCFVCSKEIVSSPATIIQRVIKYAAIESSSNPVKKYKMRFAFIVCKIKKPDRNVRFTIL